jgi:HK97 family phage prohead protease
MYKLDKPQRIDKSFTITSVVEKSLMQNDVVTDDQYIEVSGYASRMYKDGAYVIDADQENVNTFGFDLKRLVNGTLPLLYNHAQDKPVGKVLSATYDQEGLLITAKIFKYPDDDLTNFVYHSVKNGVITAFSVGMLVKDFSVVTQDGEDYLQLSDSEVIEVSLVPIPSNPEALFSIAVIKGIDGEDKQVTLISKSFLKPENPEACNGLECAIKNKQVEEPMNVKTIEPEAIAEVETEKAVVLDITDDASEKLSELNDIQIAPAEDATPAEGEIVVPESKDSSTLDTGNDKPSDKAKADLVPTPEEVLQNSLVALTGLSIDNLSDEDLSQVYETLAPIIDKIEQLVIAQAAQVIKESMIITAPAA